MNSPLAPTTVVKTDPPAPPLKKAAEKLEKTTFKADAKPGNKAEKPKKEKVSKNDEFGFRKGTKTSDAAKMYATGAGATTEEITKALGHAHLNLFKKVGKAGYVQEHTFVKNDKGGLVKKYKLVKKAQKK